MRPPAMRGDASVALAAVLFGITIPLSKIAVDDGAGAWSVVAVRFLTGAVVLAPYLRKRWYVRPVIGASSALAIGYLLLAESFEHTLSTTAAFISYLLVVIVPVLSALLLRRPPDRGAIVGIAVAVIGLILLTGGIDSMHVGEWTALGAAFAFSIHVLLLSRYSARVEAAPFAAQQLLVVGLVTLPFGLADEGGGAGPGALAALALSGVAGAIALVFQQAGQRTVSPSRTSLLLMIDPVVAAAGGFVLGERIGWRGAAGCALILAGVAAGEALDPTVKERRR